MGSKTCRFPFMSQVKRRAFRAAGSRTHLGGFRARPARAQPRGRASRAEGPDRQSDAVARDPSKGDGASSIRRCRRPGTRSFERRTRFVRIVQSTGEASNDEALLQNVAGKKEPFRNPILQTHDRQEVDLRILKTNQKAGRDLRAQTSDERSLKIAIGAAAAARTRIPNRTSGHLKMKILIGPLDT